MNVSRKFMLFASLAALLLSQGEALGDPTTQSTQLADKTADENQVLCRFTQPVTGTRLGGGMECRPKVERTQAQDPLPGKPTMQHRHYVPRPRHHPHAGDRSSASRSLSRRKPWRRVHTPRSSTHSISRPERSNPVVR